MEATSTIVKIVLLAEALLAVVIVALSLQFYLLGNIDDTAKCTAYDAVVIKTLLPLFNATITVVLTWVLAKPVVQALVVRFIAGRN